MHPQDTAIPCETEPVHAPGWVQSFGCLLACTPDGIIAHASANSAAFVGFDALFLCGQPLDVIADPDLCASFFAARKQCLPGSPQQLTSLTLRHDFERPLDICMHFYGGHLLIEIEEHAAPKVSPYNVSHQSGTMQNALYDGLRQLHQTQTVKDLCACLVRQVAVLIGYDRVMVYQFDKGWRGTVIAQHKVAQMGSYLGQSFPASDIPAPARDIFMRTDSRIIVDVDASPVPLVPVLNPLSGLPLDMGITHLRSPSPVHLEYLRHMEVQGTMTLALCCEGALWGLVACHHRTARWIPILQRQAAEMLVKTASALLVTRQAADSMVERETLAGRMATLTVQLTEYDDFIRALIGGPITLANFFAPTEVSAALLMEGVWHYDGHVPSPKTLDAIVTWLETHHVGSEYIHSESMVQDGIVSASDVDVRTTSGLLAISLPKSERAYILWFKPEVIHAIDWAGRPEKFARQDAVDGPTRYHPRASFSLWQQTVHGHCEPFTPTQITAALTLRKVLIELDLERQVVRERAARAAIEAEKQRFALLVRAGEFLGATLQDDTALQSLAQFLVTQFCDWFVVFAPVEQQLTRTVMAHRTQQGAAAIGQLRQFGTSFAELGYSYAAPFLTREPLFMPFVPQPRADMAQSAYMRLVFDTLGMQSCILIPLQARGQLLGVLKFVRAPGRAHFDKADFALALQMSERVATTLDNMALYKQSLAAGQSREYTLGVVSHDLRNPLGVVTLSTALLRRRLKNAGEDLIRTKVEPALSKIDTACRTMNRLIDDVLSAAKIEAGHFQIIPKSFDGRTLLDDVWHALEPLCEAASIELDIDSAPKASPLWGDVDRLKQAFGNLVGNALKFSKKGGKITLGLTQDDHGGIFFVRDTGCGIPADKLPQVFDRYWQADRASGGGAGLGLSIVRGITEAHGGHVWVESTPQVGSTFYFTCPLRPKRN